MTATPTILLRSGWQTVNIGDIAHTPGMLRLLQRHLPRARVILWSDHVDRGVDAMLRRDHPNLTDIRPLSDPSPLDAADLLLHGSGPMLVGEPQVRQWLDRHPGKPFGVVGITAQDPSPATASLLDRAAFLYTRETRSLEHLARAGVTRPTVGFAPDATFACDSRDDATGDAYLRSVGLSDKRFVCVIPRLRRTPYYRIHPDPAHWTPQRIAEVDDLNARHAEPDAAKLRAVIVRYVRHTGGRVLVCPEMEYQLAIQKPLLIDPLPDDVRSHVVNRETYWITDEAAAVYRRAEGLVGCECHSPILCAVAGVTGFYLRQPQDTIKGQMYHDLGLSDRTAEIDQTTADALGDQFLRLIDRPSAAREALAAAMRVADDAMAAAMATVRANLAQPPSPTRVL